VYKVFLYTILEVDTLHIAMTIVIATKQMGQKMKGQVKAQANIEAVEKGTFGAGH
tara:strand:+ start:281 stop:445 length:165 start_codon:yes stop_codon:yes gene_type:complete